MPFPPQPYVFIQLATEQTETMTNDVPQLMSRKLISASQMRGEFFSTSSQLESSIQTEHFIWLSASFV